MPGKISRLPQSIREQLNQRLANGQTSELILPWLNALPEVQSLLETHFESQPVSGQNLCEYRQRGFRNWQAQRAALEFAAGLDAPDLPGQPLAASPLLERFVQWISMRLAAVAQSSPVPDDPQDELRFIRTFVAEIVALRRGDLISRRTCVEEQKLAAAQAKNQQDLESQFWEWTRRPDIQSRLFPHRDPDKLRRDVVRMLDRELLGRNQHPAAEPEPDPACVI